MANSEISGFTGIEGKRGTEIGTKLCNLWLPDYAMELVLNKISLSERIPLRRVCRSWSRQILLCRPQDESSARSNSKLPLVVGPRSITTFNKKKHNWREKSLSFVLLNDAVQSLESSGGLLCATTKHSDLFIVHNPVTAQSRYVELPDECIFRVEKSRSAAVIEAIRGRRYLHSRALRRDGLVGLFRGILGLIHDQKSGSYKIVFASTHNESSRTTLVYDSSTRSWTDGGKVPDGIHFWYGGDCRISCNGSLYCLAQGLSLSDGMHLLSCVLVKYDPQKKQWNRCAGVPDCTESDRYQPFLVAHRENVLFVARDLRQQTMTLFVLDDSNPKQWRLLGTLPRKLSEQLNEIAHQDTTHCAGKDDLLFITAMKKTGSGVVGLIFDVESHVWTWLPELQLRDENLLSALRIYEPSLQPV